MNLTIAKFLASVLVIMLHQSVGQQWVEEVDRVTGEPTDMDIYFDRVVMITFNHSTTICTGVLIDHQRVLTAFNPFRRYQRDMRHIYITLLNTRARINKTNTFNSRGHYVQNIACHKKVKPIKNSELTSEQWHGFKKEHSPVHDLYVIKYNDLGVKLLDPNPRLYSFDKIGNIPTIIGPMITILAKRNDTLGSGMKFASLGYRHERHVVARLRSYVYPYGTNAEVDCDEWIIRDWGRFICLKNKENYLGISAGAVLIHKEKLYGIGCFTLKKGNESIYVFTDIREYRKEIFNTCGRPPARGSDIFKHQHDPSENYTTTTTPRPFLHLGRRYDDDWF